MRKVDLLANVPPEEPNDSYIVASLFFVKRKPVLELTWISTEDIEPQLIRHFVWKDHWATYRGKKAYQDAMWTHESYSTLVYGLWYTYSRQGIARAADEVVDVFLKKMKTARVDIDGYETEIKSKKEAEAIKRKEKRIAERMKQITPALPSHFIRWAKAQEKARYIYLLQLAPEGYVIDRRFDREVVGERVVITEVVRGFNYAPGQWWREYYYGEYYDRYGMAQKFWDKKGYGMSSVDKKGVLYPGTLEDIPMISDSARLAMIHDAEHGVVTNYGAMYQLYQRDDRAERIVKSGYPELIREWRRRGVSLYNVKPRDGVHEMLNISKATYKVLREINADKIVILAAQKEKYTIKQLRELAKVPGLERKKEIERLAERRGLPLTHLITLLKTRPTEDVSCYSDYLDMAEEKGMDIRDEIVYRNKRWKEYHDRYIQDLQKAKMSKRMKDVNRRFKNIKQKAAANQEHFGWQYKGYVMIAAKKASEIVMEGQLQHHCVGSSDNYMDKMNSGESYILFFRKKETDDIPYYTIEATYDGKILQAYAAYDRKPEWDLVHPILEKWRKEVVKRTKQEAKA